MQDLDVEKLSNDEFRALDALKRDGRMSATELSRVLGVSRATASRVIESLKRKGIKFVPQFYEGSLFSFVITDRSVPIPEGAEAYDLIDGGRLLVLKGSDIGELEKQLSDVPNKRTYYISTRKIGEKVVRASLLCDYCGGPIHGAPLIFKRGRRTYYACCHNCLSGLRKKLGQLQPS
jgi:DNA-binding transcriptional ArsR family regulator